MIDHVVETLLLASVAALAWNIIQSDLAGLEISVSPVLWLTGLAILTGIVFPLPGLAPDAALAGAATGLGLGTLTRGYIHMRTGVAAFGGADIAMLTAGGALLGPGLLGPWVISAAVLGLVMSPILSQTRFRRMDIDGVRVSAAPFCPALITSAALVHTGAALGLFGAAY